MNAVICLREGGSGENTPEQSGLPWEVREAADEESLTFKLSGSLEGVRSEF